MPAVSFILIIQYPACAVFDRICMAGTYPYRFRTAVPCTACPVAFIGVSSLGIIHKTNSKDSSYAEYGAANLS